MHDSWVAHPGRQDCRRLDLVNYVGVALVARVTDFPAVAGGVGEGSVTEIAAEQVAVRVGIQNPPAEVVGSSPRWAFATAPRQIVVCEIPVERRDPVVAEPVAHQLLHVVKFGFRVRHMRTYVPIAFGASTARAVASPLS